VLGDPRANRSLVALMNAHAILGGAAAHWGGPAALAEIVSALHGLFFDVQGEPWHERFNFVNDAGHCENGIYACRANLGFDELTLESLRGFRGVDSKLSGHGEQHLNPEGVLFSNGPLGSALAQAQGICLADRMSGKERLTVCIMTDGASMEGEAREAFASIPGFAGRGQMNPFVMVLSDNGTKLSGRIHEDSFSMQPTFQALETMGWDIVRVDQGNDLQVVYNGLEDAFARAWKNPERPVLVWARTVKGYGVKATEDDAGGGHGFPAGSGMHMRDFVAELYRGLENIPEILLDWAAEVERLSTEAKNAKAAAPKSSLVLKKVQAGYFPAMDKLVQEGLPILSVTSDLGGSTGVGPFQKKYPERCIDVGVAEANMIGIAAGLSRAGYIPVVDTFAQFGITKGNLPLIMSALSHCPVVALFSHNGLQDAADGASHQAITSFAATSAIPYTDVVCCATAADGEAYLEQALRRIHEARKIGESGRTTLIFMGREDFPVTYKEGLTYPWGKAQVLREGKSVVIAAAGYPAGKALQAAELLAAEGIQATVVQNAFVNHPDIETILPLVRQCGGRLVTVEDNVITGGAGAQLIHALTLAGAGKLEVRSLGIRENFGRSAYMADHLYKLNGMDVQHIAQAARELL